MRRVETVPAGEGRRCGQVYSDGRGYAACAWPGAVLTGNGGYAVLVRCASERLYAERWPVARVVLTTDPQGARNTAGHYDGFGCGLLHCRGDHSVVRLPVGAG